MGPGVLGRVEVRHPLGDIVADPVRQELVGIAKVPLGLPGDQRLRRGQGGLLGGDTEQAEGIGRVPEVDHLGDMRVTISTPRSGCPASPTA